MLCIIFRDRGSAVARIECICRLIFERAPPPQANHHTSFGRGCCGPRSYFNLQIQSNLRGLGTEVMEEVDVRMNARNVSSAGLYSVSYGEY